MKFEPHEYQKYAIDWIVNHPVCGVFLDMGLGKTVITLTALQILLFERFEARKVLVIAPLRVARDTWKAEAAKWEHLSGLRLSAAVGHADARQTDLREDADIYVINRENVPWLIRESGIRWEFDTVVIDELSSFKNHQAKRYKALFSERKKISRIIGLTGTPSANGPEDLWAEFKLLDMGERLGKYIGTFRDLYEVPDRRGPNIIYNWKPKPGAFDAIQKKISDVTISMKSVDHLNMPELISAETRVRMEPREREIYDRLKDRYVLHPGEEDQISAANAAVLSGKLSQLANGAIYDDTHGVQIFHDRKLDALGDLIEAMNGQPVLVAYRFRHDYDRIRRRLDQIGVAWQKIDSPHAIDCWNAGKLNVGLVHPASAGHGLNLQTGGSHLIWYSPVWSLELYQQTNARLWRQGQEAGTVVIQHILTEDTIDEDIMGALKNKNMNQEALIEALKARLRRKEWRNWN